MELNVRTGPTQSLELILEVNHKWIKTEMNLAETNLSQMNLTEMNLNSLSPYNQSLL